MNRCLVTGATGFIGGHLVKQLAAQQTDTTCLIRSSSDRSRLEPYNPGYVVGDVADRDSIRTALDGVDVVYHLAGVTKSLGGNELRKANVEGVRCVAECCGELDRPPLLIVVSSLAAAGPARDHQPLTEQDPPTPVSHYGRSKREGELAALKFAASVPTSIVRPPIVLGEGDRDGFVMFRSIKRWGIHVAPGLAETSVSIIHADDLANALLLVAGRGSRVDVDGDRSQGIYFAAADEIPTYSDLGRMIGDALGKKRVRVFHSPSALVWTIGGISEAVSQLIRKPSILNLDKAREATAGSWICSAKKLAEDTGFAPQAPLAKRLKQTADWYVQQGWL